MMNILKATKARKTFPTGNPNFSVMQAFPAGLNEYEVDPFLMCDYFGPSASKGQATDPDEFPVQWHPHVGMDICTYLKQGTGRHADSLGNRETYETPGMQWISVGSGIEHAEGGGTPEGKMDEGFQLWFNTPAEFKKRDPTYGTEDPKSLPVLPIANGASKATILAGKVSGVEGPFKTVQPVQVVDFEFNAGVDQYDHVVPADFDQCVLFVYNGSGRISDSDVGAMAVLKLNAADAAKRIIKFSTAAESPMKVMLFAGKQIKQPIAWHGPFVMNTDQEIREVMLANRTGRFPPKRVPWDYKNWRAFPKK